MTDMLKGKSVPWDSIQKYITTLQSNQATLNQIISLKDQGILDVSEV